MPLPSLFISHGSPMLALAPGASGPALRALAQSMPRPQAIVVVSAHWQSDQLLVTHNPQPATWHDFGGFPAALYEVQYPAPGLPKLAERVVQLLSDADLSAALDAHRPFDHGAWVPLSLMYPEADIPVVQVSLPAPHTPSIVRSIGQALAALREDGVLLIGSGSITHNLAELDRQAAESTDATTWAKEFRDWVVNKLTLTDTEALLNYRQHAPSAKRNHPTDEHLLPLYFAYGAGGTFKVEHTGFTYGTLGMDIYSFA